MNKGILGNSTEAIVNTNTSLDAQREKTIQLLSKLVSTMTQGASGDNMTPFVVGIKDGKPICIECKVNEDGTIELPEMKVNSRNDIKMKNTLVKKITDIINPTLKAEIENVTYIALMRKDTERLRRFLNALKKGDKPRLENRVGCIWIIIGEEEFII